MTVAKRTGIVYIVSAGHSGSTLLDFLLGSIPGVMSTGELTHLPHILEYDRDELGSGPRDPAELKLRQGGACSCLMPFRECPVWSAVVNRLCSELQCNLWANPARLKMAVLRGRHTSKWHRRDWARHHLLHRPLRALSFAACGRRTLAPLDALFRTALLDGPARTNARLYHHIADVAGCRYVVDSSKDPMRMMAVQSIRPDDVRLVVLSRDLRGVVYSAYRRGLPYQGRVKAWRRGYTRLPRILKALGNCPTIHLSYERLASEPGATQRHLAEFLGLPEPPELTTLNTTDFHIVAGNPMRFHGEIRIQLDDAWRENLPEELIHRYGRIQDRHRARMPQCDCELVTGGGPDGEIPGRPDRFG